MNDTREDFGRVEDGKLVNAPRILKVQAENPDGSTSLKTILHPTEEDYANAVPPYFPMGAAERPVAQPGYQVVLDRYVESEVGGKTVIVPIFIQEAIDPADEQTIAQVLRQYDDAMERYLQFMRDERGYTSREPSDYAMSQNARWHQDALDWIAFRDDVMSYALSVMNEFKSSGRAVSIEDFITGMPRIIWTEE